MKAPKKPIPPGFTPTAAIPDPEAHSEEQAFEQEQAQKKDKGGKSQPKTSTSAKDALERAFIDFEPAPKPEIKPVWDFAPNDDGRAAFFIAHFGEILRYVPELNQWRFWHNQRWHTDSIGKVAYLCQLLSRHMQTAADTLAKELSAKVGSQLENEGRLNTTGTTKLKQKDANDIVKQARANATHLGNDKMITALLNAAARHPSVIAPMAQWDADPWRIGTLNGTLDLQTLTHRPGRPEDYITRSISVAYDPHASCPNWQQFVERILPVETRDYVQKLAGYSLTGHTDDQAFYFLYGTGKNGKSIFIAVLAAIFGSYGGKARRNLIEEPRNGADCKHDIAQLPGLRFLHGEETSAGGKLREDEMKSITGGDKLTGEAKYCDPFTFTPVGKLWLMGNHKPRIEGTDPGIWRRVRLIPFTTTISDAEEIPTSVLLAKLLSEASGILNWMLHGLKQCSSFPIPMPPVVKSAVEDYRQSEDELGDFIEECTQDAADHYREPKETVFKAYLAWAVANGIHRTHTMKQFTRRIGGREGWKLDPGRRAWMAKSVKASAEV